MSLRAWGASTGSKYNLSNGNECAFNASRKSLKLVLLFSSFLLCLRPAAPVKDFGSHTKRQRSITPQRSQPQLQPLLSRIRQNGTSMLGQADDAYFHNISIHCYSS